MRDIDRPVVALIERRSSDEQVLREARAHTVASAAPLVLVHVAPLPREVPPGGSRWRRHLEPWQRMQGLEATIRYELRGLAGEWVGPATRVGVVVRFGDPVTELASVVEHLGGRLVVAGSERRRWTLGWDRDERLRWAINGPLQLVGSSATTGRVARLAPVPAAARWRP